MNRRAPSFTREQLGALIANLVVGFVRREDHALIIALAERALETLPAAPCMQGLDLALAAAATPPNLHATGDDFGRIDRGRSPGADPATSRPLSLTREQERQIAFFVRVFGPRRSRRQRRAP